MSFRAVALDYDDTLATGGRVPPDAVRALTRLRSAGFRIVLVTGREFAELRAVAPDLRIFDRVVLENGAVLHNPSTCAHAVLAPPPGAYFLKTLERRGVYPVSVGEVVVAAARQHEDILRALIRELGLRLEVICNGDSAMVLPSGIDKMTGLQIALEELGLTAQEVVGIGNGENDHAFLDQCGFSAAVANSVATLKASARMVTDGERGEGVVEIAEMLIGGRLGTRTPDPFGVNEVL